MVAGFAVASPAARMAADWLSHQPTMCPLLRYTGVACPSCGGTRASLYLLGGDPVSAFKMNAALTAATLTLGVLALAGKVDFPRKLGVANPSRAVAN